MARTRRGFTLVELLVVMSLIIVIAGLAVAVTESGAFGSQKVVSAADRASGWLLVAKQRAVRDQRPRGVRFLLNQEPDAAASTLSDYRNYSYTAREAQYIELPDLWVPNPTNAGTGPALVVSIDLTVAPPLLPVRLFYVSFAATPAAIAADMADFDGRGLKAGDMVTFGGATFRLDADPPTPSGGAAVQSAGTTLTATNSRELRATAANELARQFGYGATQDVPASAGPPAVAATAAIRTTTFAIQQAPRPLVGEPLLQLTANTVIDVRSKSYEPAVGGNPNMPTPVAVYKEDTPAAAAWPATSTGITLQPVEAYNPGNPADTRKPEFFDVMFAPSGQVMNTPAAQVMLWVRDPDKVLHPRLAVPGQFSTSPRQDQQVTYDDAGDQVLVSVSTRTGLIATHRVEKGTDPHVAAKDGLNSGL